MKRLRILGVVCICTTVVLSYGFLRRMPSEPPPIRFFSEANESDVIALLNDRRLRLGYGGNRAHLISADDDGSKPASTSLPTVKPPVASGDRAFRDLILGVGRHKAEPLTVASDAGSKTTLASVAEFPSNVGQISETGKDEQRLSFIKKMMQHAWSNYEEHSWGRNELAPLTQLSHDGPFAGTAIGLTIIDSLDTLHLMGMSDELSRAKDWCLAHLQNRLTTPIAVSAFEFNIRVLGSFLSMYALTGDSDYKNLSILAAGKLLPVFGSASGIPYSTINLQSGFREMWHWANGAVLAEVGSYHLEFAYMARVTAGEGGVAYINAVEKARDVLDDAEKPFGLYMNFVNPLTGQFTADRTASMGALGDSFYEYLLKSWLLSGRTDRRAKRMYYAAIKAMQDNDMIRTSSGGLTYIGIFRNRFIEVKMEHLACFSGGLIALGAADSDDPAGHMNLAEELARTCHESYVRSAIGLGPEAFGFISGREAVSGPDDARQYQLRPELVETYFVLWRLTHKPQYRVWAWEVVQALQKYSMSAHGYSGVIDVYADKPVRDDVQQSYFIAETLKYLYLTFEDDSVLPLDQWVFNTEAHPLPVAPLVAGGNQR